MIDDEQILDELGGDDALISDDDDEEGGLGEDGLPKAPSEEEEGDLEKEF